MQLIYAIQTMEQEQKKSDGIHELQKRLDDSGRLFIYLLYTLTEVARYAETDAYARASKNLPSQEDKNVNTRITANTFLWKILDDTSFQKSVEKYKPQLSLDKEVTRKLYYELIATEEYKRYIYSSERQPRAEKEILLFIFSQILLPSVHFTAQIEEYFNNWDDDADAICQLAISYLQKPGSYDVSNIVGEEKWKFARELLSTTIEKKEYLSEMIHPKLKNWDPERIAQLDMIVLQMGVAEFLYFETIPPKVTINEYIDIAKEYSTQQSGQFVNGILDTIHKELLANNKIHKIDFRSKTA